MLYPRELHLQAGYVALKPLGFRSHERFRLSSCFRFKLVLLELDLDRDGYVLFLRLTSSDEDLESVPRLVASFVQCHTSSLPVMFRPFQRRPQRGRPRRWRVACCRGVLLRSHGAC